MDMVSAFNNRHTDRILLINPEATTGQQAGSIYVMDSYFDGVATAIYADSLPKTILESSVVTLDNIGVTGVSNMVGFSDGSFLAVAAEDLDFLIIGSAEADGDAFGTAPKTCAKGFLLTETTGMYNMDVETPPSVLTDSTKSYYRDSYFYESRPQYEDVAVADVVNVKTMGAKGDGVTDDTSTVAAALEMATTSNFIYLPPGSNCDSGTPAWSP